MILEIIAREGRRFMKQKQSNESNIASQKNEILWVEVEELEARNKVASGFRGALRTITRAKAAASMMCR